MFKNLAGQSVTLMAVDASTGLQKVSDSANMLFYVSKDDGAVTLITAASGVPTEVDATNGKGLYKIALAQGETNADKLLFSGKSSTSNIVVVPATIYTQPTTGILAPATSGRTLVVDASGLADANAVKLGPTGAGTAQTARDIGASVIAASVTGAVGSVTGAVGSITGVSFPSNFSALVIDSTGRVNAFLIGILTSVFTEGAAGRIAAAFKQFFNIATPAATMDHGILVDTATSAGSVSGAVGSVTGAVGSVTGAVGSVTGNVGGNIVGSVASVSGNVGGNVSGNVSGSVGSVTGAVGSVTGAVGSVSGNVGGNVVGSAASVSGAVGSVAGNVGGDVTGKVLGGGASSITGDGVRAASVTGAVGSVTGAIGSYTGDTPQTGDCFPFADRTVGRGTVGATSPTTTTFTPSALTPAGVATDQFKGRIIIFDRTTATTALRGQATDITASSAASLPLLTFTALTTAPSSGDTFSVA